MCPSSRTEADKAHGKKLRAQFRLFVTGSRRPFLDPEGLVHWPVLFFYPENMQSDAIEDFCEADSLSDHLDVMFSPTSPPLEWDTEHLYTRKRLRLYYLSYAAAPLKPDQLAEARLSPLFLPAPGFLPHYPI